MPSLTPEYDYHSCRRDADTSVDRSLYLKKKRHERPSARAATPERGLGHAAHVVADIPSRLEVLILRKLAEKGSTATGQPQGAMQSRKQSSTQAAL